MLRVLHSAEKRMLFLSGSEVPSNTDLATARALVVTLSAPHSSTRKRFSEVLHLTSQFWVRKSVSGKGLQGIPLLTHIDELTCKHNSPGQKFG